MFMRTAGLYGRPLGKSKVEGLPQLSSYDPFPVISPLSTWDGRVGVAQLGMLGNGPDPTVPNFSGAGCCVFAAYVHTLMLASWRLGTQPVGNYADYNVWCTSAQLLTAYFTFTGSPHPTNFNWSQENGFDVGADPGQALIWFSNNTIGPIPKLPGFAEIDPDGGEMYEGAMATFGSTYEAIVVYDSMMTASSNGLPWTQTSGTVDGGHMVVHSYRDPKIYECVTWGIEQEGNWPNFRATREQGYVLLSPAQMATAGGVKLQADIQALGGCIG